MTPETFTQLVQAWLPTVHAITTAVTTDPVLAEEATQETFVAAWRQWPQLRDPERPGPWLRGIARQRALDAVRRRARSRESAMELDAVPDPGIDATRRLERDDDERALWQALEALEPDDREVLVLYYREGGSVREVCARLDLQEAAVRKRLSRARERLRGGVEARLGERLGKRNPRAGAVVAAALGVLGVAAPARAAWIAGPAAAAACVLVLGGLGAKAAAPPAPPTLPGPSAVVLRAAPPPDADPRSVAAATLPVHVVAAFLAAEDARFFEHGAVDARAVVRALWNNGTGGELQGGSTITQQLAKTITPPSTPLHRKLHVVWNAWRLEEQHDKLTLLARYLETVYLGSGQTGLVAASKHYFGKAPSELTVDEAALLAGIPANPAAYGPRESPAGSRTRQAWVLRRMRELWPDQGW